jgi:hypothetical protein
MRPETVKNSGLRDTKLSSPRSLGKHVMDGCAQLAEGTPKLVSVKKTKPTMDLAQIIRSPCVHYLQHVVLHDRHPKSDYRYRISPCRVAA